MFIVMTLYTCMWNTRYCYQSHHFIQLTLPTFKAALPVHNVKEYLIIMKFANILLGFFPFKLKKLFGVLQEYLIINNILLYDIKITGVDCVFVCM